MRACLFGTYDSQHTVNRIYARVLRAAGYELAEYHAAVWEKTPSKTRSYFRPLGLVGRALAWLRAAVGLARRWRKSGGCPLVVVGFNGQLDIMLLRLLAPRKGPRIVFAPLVSLGETLVDDRGVYRPGSLAARVIMALDRLSCRLADVVVTDTKAHRDYFINVVGVRPESVQVCYLGPDPRELGGPEPGSGLAHHQEDGDCEVLWFGSYLPLHGLDVIAGALDLLAGRSNLKFTFIGDGPGRVQAEARLKASGARVSFHGWMSYEKLRGHIARADIVLGIFGRSAKASMVIPNKVYAAAAQSRAIIGADSAAMRELFDDGSDVVLCKPKAGSLARAIVGLVEDQASRDKIGSAAGRLIAERFSDKALADAWSSPLGGPRAADSGQTDQPRVGVAVLNFNDAASTLRCVASVVTGDYENYRLLIIDNCSQTSDLRRLEEGMAGRFEAHILRLPENVGYAGANNLALAELFGQGCDQVLLLNDDTVVSPGAIGLMVEASDGHGGGLVGPRISRDWPASPAASLGERYWAATAWLPRSLLRYRRPRQVPYPVGGLMGCALLVSRALWEKVGGFDEDYFAYYEEVDLCLRARRAGIRPLLVPMAEVAHAGHRGFGSGMTALSAYLKARNLLRLGRRRLGWGGFVLFLPGYFLMVAASMVVYSLRGRLAVLRAMAAGVVAGIRGGKGKPPGWLWA
ncbi:MAG: glycosyltransferase [Deltaproteobacteria bacterium]